MARSFVRTSSQYLEVDSPPVTAAPFTVAAWVWTDEGSNDKVVAFIGDKDSATQYWYLAVDASERVLWEANATTAARARSGVVFGLSQWNHLVGVERSATDREVYYNGASQATNATSKAPSGADRISLGRSGSSSPGIYWDDHLAEIAVWDVGLNTDEITALSKGVSPLLIRPGSLVFYVPLIRDADKDIVGGLALTAFNTPTVTDHPRVFNPTGGRVGQADATSDVTISCSVGALSLGGQAASVVPGAVTIGANVGALSLAGQSSSVVPGAVTIAAVAGALALGGQSASVVPGEAVIGVSVAGLSLAGVSGVVSPGAVAVEVSPGVLVLGGQGGTVISGEAIIAAIAGLLSLGGQAASIVPGAVAIGIQVGSLSLAGVGASVLPGGVGIGVQVGSLSLDEWGATVVVAGGGGGGFDDHVILRGHRRAMERRME